MVRRVIGVILGSVALVAGLSGCLLPLDTAKPGVLFTNDSSQELVVTIEGLGDEFPRMVPSQRSFLDTLDECVGTGIRVEAESGQLLGRIDKQACPNWTLTVNEDGTLDYVENK